MGRVLSLRPATLEQLLLEQASLTQLGAGESQSISVQMPPVSWEVTSEAGREGRTGSTLAGRGWLLGTTHYVYTVHDGQDVDPQFAGRTGIPVPLGAGNHTGAAHASAAASAISSTPGFSAEAVDDVLTTQGAGSFADGSVAYEGAGQRGLLGMQYEAPSGSFGVDTFRVQGIDASALPGSGTIRITGYRIRWGSTHTGQIQAAIYQGGTLGAPDSNVALVSSMGATAGAVTNDNVWVTLDTPITLDLADGPIWIGWMGDGGSSAISSVSTTGQAASATSDFFNGGGGTAIFVAGGSPPSGSGGTFPSTFTSGGASFGFVTSFALVYEVGPFQDSTLTKGRIGTDFPGPDFADGTSDATLVVGNSYTLPAVLGREIAQASVNYDTHVEGSDYRLSWLEGGSADDNAFGATAQDIGQTSGTDTGWVDVDIDEGTSIPISDSGGRAWIQIHCDFANAGGTSVLSFDAAGADIFGPDENPARYYNGASSESERTPAGGTTNINFDPTVALPSPFEPDGTNLNPGNNVGVRVLYRIPGVRTP